MFKYFVSVYPYMIRGQVERKGYLRQLDMFRDNTQLVKIITGVRRCGKSTLLDQFAERLKSGGVHDSNILRMNLESAEFEHVDDHHKLNDYLYSRIPKAGRSYIFLDEIQRVKEWERTVNALMVDTDADIYITGSNAHLLSTELSTFLTGRYISIRMLPLSFLEYRELRSNGRNDMKVFRDYMDYGGLPIVDPLAGETAVLSILKDLYSSIIYQDIVSRGKIRNPGELERLVQYMMMNIGNPTSLRNIAEGLSGSHRNTVERYVGLLEEACLLYKVNRYDLRSTSLNPTPKYYSVDTGLRNMVTGLRRQDVGRVLENIVYLELLRRGCNVTVGKWDSKEVDFVAEMPRGGREYFQVCMGYNDEETEKRELAPLRMIEDNFPKTILLLDGLRTGTTEDGIIERSIIDWLLEDQTE